jgi:hypothetical protein
VEQSSIILLLYTARTSKLPLSIVRAVQPALHLSEALAHSSCARSIVIPFCNQVIAKCFAQTPRGLAALRKFFLHIERKAVLLQRLGF